MLTPIVCLTCGCPIGDIEDLFRHMRAARVRELLGERGTDVSQAAIDVGLQLDCSDILELLGVRNDCCRAHLVSAMIFDDYY
jgi:DNA-directed RNA polymerase subunit N (RpoN/RPB10)